MHCWHLLAALQPAALHTAQPAGLACSMKFDILHISAHQLVQQQDASQLLDWDLDGEVCCQGLETRP